MKKNLRDAIILLVSVFIWFDHAQAQPGHFVYAITSSGKDGSDWIVLRKLNTQTVELTTVFTSEPDKTISLYEAGSNKIVDHFIEDTIANSSPQMAFGNGVAAIAFDKATNRLYFVAVLVDQLRYIDLSTMKTYCVTGQSFGKAGKFIFHAGSINRMVIAPDGYGYTITNDGNHLFRFTSNGSPVITDLGPLSDLPTNNETIHNECGNAGGDIIADDNGSLYLITASNRVFKVDIGSGKTQFLGLISGLPQKFTTSGAAVIEDGNLLISSSMYSEGYFSVDPETWVASPYRPMSETYNTADLASNNVLISKPSSLIKLPSTNSNNVKVYPNPVSADAFNIQFNDLKAGNYTVELSDVVGTPLLQQKIKVNLLSQTEVIHFSGNNAQGFYFLKVLDENKITVFTQIMVVGR